MKVVGVMDWRFWADLKRIASKASRSPDWQKVSTKSGLDAKSDRGCDRGAE